MTTIYSKLEQATYREALAKCEHDGMKLAVIEGEEEMKNVMEYLTYTGKSCNQKQFDPNFNEQSF